MATPRLLTIVLAILIIAVGAGLTIYWFRRPVPSDRQQVMDVFLQMQRAAERKSLSGVMRHIADDYDDGTYTRRDLMRLGVSAFREPEPFNIVATVRSLGCGSRWGPRRPAPGNTLLSKFSFRRTKAGGR